LRREPATADNTTEFPIAMKISLTFDNGPEPDVTPHVLDTLARHDLQATFFLLGKNLAVPERRKIAERAFAEGHRLGNHSYSHSVPFGLLVDPAAAAKEILATDELLGDLRGGTRLYRPFGRAQIGKHLLNRVAWETLVTNAYTCVLWSCTSPERDFPDTWMDGAVQMCEQREWSVVVLHDLPTGAMRHLDRFLSMLAERGAQFSQDFPSDLTPLRNGVPVGPHDHLISP
jgi:peptidoglycan/xylan/chitin deacetylase (PgdA/CDA1 family)